METDELVEVPLEEQLNTCCVCFVEKLEDGVSLADIDAATFEGGILPDELMVKGPCGEHFICIRCMRYIINNYTNHPINENNSHFACPYPFKECMSTAGTRNIFEHHHVHKVCRTEEEWNNYVAHSARFEFPGYTVVKCPFDYTLPISMMTRIEVSRKPCGANILIENGVLRDNYIGDVIVECSQNIYCNKRFCYHCKSTISYYANDCSECKLTHENENENVFNYYFNKNTSAPMDDVKSGGDDETQETLIFEEGDYLFLNKEITEEIAIEQILSAMDDVNTYIICPVCKISLYKTEKCNGLSHHGVERCYACGRIGFRIKGLGEHWSASGVEGCFRFDHENFVRTRVPDFMCHEESCFSHEVGDCAVENHQPGIHHLQEVRITAYVFHMLKSLLPAVRYSVYDELHKRLEEDEDKMKYLPYKQTLMMIEKHKDRSRDYTEEIVYSNLDCTMPDPKQDKNNVMEVVEYMVTHKVQLFPDEPDEPDKPDEPLRWYENRIFVPREDTTERQGVEQWVEQIMADISEELRSAVLTRRHYTTIPGSDTESDSHSDTEPDDTDPEPDDTETDEIVVLLS